MKKIGQFIVYVNLLILATAQSFAYTANCGQLAADLASGEAPSPMGIICVLARVLNIALYLIGFAVVALVAYGAYKLSMSQGDPKGIEGAKLHLTYVMMGLFIVIFFFVIFSVIGNLLGLPPLTPDAVLGRIESALSGFLDAALNQR